MNILIVDDHEVVRQGLKTLLSRRPKFNVVGEAGSVAEAIEKAAATNPDVVIMDIRLADGTGVEACREIRASNPSTKVIMLTSYSDDQAIFDSIVAGASAYLLKQVESKALVSAIERVGNGESLLDPAVTQSVMEKVRTLISQPPEAKGPEPSAQEQRVLALIAEGKTNREIGQEMYLSEKTVKNYVSSILDKFNLSRRSEAAAYYVRRQVSLSNDR